MVTQKLRARPSLALQGSWRARVVGSRVVWTNLHSLCELHLTGEGFFFLSDWDRWRSARPQAVLVEYGLAGVWVWVWVWVCGCVGVCAFYLILYI